MRKIIVRAKLTQRVKRKRPIDMSEEDFLIHVLKYGTHYMKTTYSYSHPGTEHKFKD